MPSNQKYFDITIKHKYDSVTTSGKENLKKLTTIISLFVLVCSSLLIFSIHVSQISEAKEDINGKAMYFPTPVQEAKRTLSTTVMTSTTSTAGGKESETRPVTGSSVTGTSVSAVTNNTSKIKKEETINLSINSAEESKDYFKSKEKEKKKSKKKSSKKKKKSTKTKKIKKTKKVFHNLTTKKKKAKAIWNKLKSEGYEEGAIAGVLGNIEQESNFNEKHSIDNGATYKGMFQLSKNDRFQNCINWCGKNGFNPWSVEGQIEFMLEEMNDEKVRTYQFKVFTGYDKEDYSSIKNPQKAASVWVAGYEGAIAGGSGLNASWQEEDKRRNYAQKWYDEFSSEI